MKLSEFQAIPTETVELAGTTISYRRIGVGEPLLMIHGWPLISATYRKLVPHGDLDLVAATSYASFCRWLQNNEDVQLPNAQMKCTNCDCMIDGVLDEVQ